MERDEGGSQIQSMVISDFGFSFFNRLCVAMDSE